MANFSATRFMLLRGNDLRPCMNLLNTLCFRSNSSQTKTCIEPSDMSSEMSVSRHSETIFLSDVEITKAGKLVSELWRRNHLSVALQVLAASLRYARCSLESLQLDDAFFDSLCRHRSHKMHVRNIIRCLRDTISVDSLTNLYRKLICKYCEQAKVMEACQLFDEMCGFCEEPDIDLIFGVIIEACCKVHRLSLALHMLRRMLLDFCLDPQPKTQIIMFRSFLREARVREAYMLQQAFHLLSHQDRSKIAEIIDQVIQASGLHD